MKRRHRNPSNVTTELTELLILGGLGWILYEILVPKNPILQTGPQLTSPASYGGPLSYLYSALTGQPTSAASVPSQDNLYHGPNAPATVAGMSTFLASGHQTSDVVPGTGQTVATLATLGYSWDWINQAFAQADANDLANSLYQGMTAGG